MLMRKSRKRNTALRSRVPGVLPQLLLLGPLSASMVSDVIEARWKSNGDSRSHATHTHTQADVGPHIVSDSRCHTRNHIINHGGWEAFLVQTSLLTFLFHQDPARGVPADFCRDFSCVTRLLTRISGPFPRFFS